MIKDRLLIVFIFIFVNSFLFSSLQSKINNNIVVKVGESLVTSIDVQNEVLTNLIINKQEITQDNINNSKNFSIKNLIVKSIKRAEINKYEIKDYNNKDLKNYLKRVEKNFNTNSEGLKNIFKQNGISYETFVKNHETELLWNTLIFKIYNKQININIVEVDREIEKITRNQNEDELKKIKEKILNKRKEEKLNLFSRSHLSNLENTIAINFQ